MNRNGSSARTLLLSGIAAALLSVAGCAGSPTQESTGDFIDDSVITTKVKSAFVQDRIVSARNISVETFKGVVHLGGYAQSREEARTAVEIARRVPGVKLVKNEINER